LPIIIASLFHLIFQKFFINIIPEYILQKLSFIKSNFKILFYFLLK